MIVAGMRMGENEADTPGSAKASAHLRRKIGLRLL